MYFIAEVTHSTKRIVEETDTFVQAEQQAVKHNFRTGIAVEIMDDRCRPLKLIQEYCEY